MQLQPLVQARDLTRRWGTGSTAQLGIDGIDLTIGRSELVAIVGPSGSVRPDGKPPSDEPEPRVAT